MSAALLDKLVKIAGMFGSNHAGERAAAAALADRLLRENLLTWADVLKAPDRPKPKLCPRIFEYQDQLCTIEDKIDFASAHFLILDDWKFDFIQSLEKKRLSGDLALTPKQVEKLDEIVAWVECQLSKKDRAA